MSNGWCRGRGTANPVITAQIKVTVVAVVGIVANGLHLEQAVLVILAGNDGGGVAFSYETKIRSVLALVYRIQQ